MPSLKPFFEPETIALIGATRKLGFGYGQTRVLLSLGFGDRLYFVNPSEKELYGKPVYEKVTDIPSPVDLALIIVPARACLSTMEECAEKGVKAAIVMAAGFSETGEEGRRIEEEMAQIARRAGIRVIGPNCIGLVNTARRFATAELMDEALKPGSIGVVAQSGVFGNILLDWAPEQGIRFSKVITIGNRCDVDESELVRYLADDDETRVMVLYLEGFRDARKTLKAFQEATRKKPILVLKSGRTDAGKAATRSHTGSLSGDDLLYGSAFRQSGAIRCGDLFELFDLAKAFASQPLPTGKKVGIVTSSGSLGALTADIAADLGLKLPSLSKETVQGISAMAPPWMNVRNPLDLGPSGLIGKGIEWVMKDPAVDGVIGIFVIPYMVVEEIRRHPDAFDQFIGPLKRIQELVNFQKDSGSEKPILFSTVGNSAFRGLLQDALGERIPLMSRPENAAKAFWAMYQYGQFDRK